MRRFGLIGYPLDHSFSPTFFREKFARENIRDASYEAFEIAHDTDLGQWLRENSGLSGLNVTVPYKEKVMPYLVELDPVAKEVGAVNTLLPVPGGWKGYNTDVIGFEHSLRSFLNGRQLQGALVLGTGGASKAVKWVLENQGIPYMVVSRTPGEGQLSYEGLKGKMKDFSLIINTTPLGTYPEENTTPDLPFSELTSEHLLFDLVYNPAKTLFLKKGEEQGARIQNGHDMLVAQAEASWAIWNQEQTMSTNEKVVDFSNSEIAFSSKSDRELKRTYRLFKIMNNSTLVKIGSQLGLFASKLGIPFVNKIIKDTVFEQFCGGTSLLDSQKVIDKLYKFNTLTVLDYGAEGKSSEDDFNRVMEETLRAVEFAASNDSVPVVSTKLTGMADDEMLERVSQDGNLSEGDQYAYDQLIQRVDNICSRAAELGVGIFIDAEESWMQKAIDDLVDQMMEKYNRKKAIVYNTIQLYRHDRLEFLRKSHQRAKENGYILGMKLVRGAYLEKERDRAKEKGYPDPTQPNKTATDADYNAAILYCLDHYEEISVCNATHNLESNQLMAEEIVKRGLQRNHPHFNFCQLMGMSDYITFNLAEEEFNVAKYVPYGPVSEVIPYLVRRAEENSSVTGEMSRELGQIYKEMKRRGLKK